MEVKKSDKFAGTLNSAHLCWVEPEQMWALPLSDLESSADELKAPLNLIASVRLGILALEILRLISSTENAHLLILH